MHKQCTEGKYIPDVPLQRILNQSYLVDQDERLFKNSILVRFEDGKLNPKATFSALATFLDLPYTESMTYCSVGGKHDAASFDGNVVGFDPATVYRTYDEFLGEPERYFIECALRHAYQAYGYDFQYYDGQPMTQDKAYVLFENFAVFDTIQRNSIETSLRHEAIETGYTEKKICELIATCKNNLTENRKAVTALLVNDFRFVNKQGKPLKFIPLLQLDPELLEAPLYH